MSAGERGSRRDIEGNSRRECHVVRTRREGYLLLSLMKFQFGNLPFLKAVPRSPSSP